MAQAPFVQFAIGDTVTFLTGSLSGAQYRVNPPGGVLQGQTVFYVLERWLDEDEVRRDIPQHTLRRTASIIDGGPPPLDTVFQIASQVSPSLFGWEVGPGSIVLFGGGQRRIQAFSLTSNGYRQVIFTDHSSSNAGSSSTAAIEAWESRFRQLDGTPVKEVAPPPVILPGQPEPPPPAVPPSAEFPELPTINDFRDAVAIIRADIETGVRSQGEHFDVIRQEIAARQAEITGVPVATAEYVGPLILESEGRLKGVLDALVPPTLTDLIALAPKLASFLENPAMAILESFGPLSIRGDINEPS